MNAFEGSGSSEGQQAPVQNEQGDHFVTEEPFNTGGSHRDSQVCPMERNTVINCLNNSTDCQWAIDMLNQCKRQADFSNSEKQTYY